MAAGPRIREHTTPDGYLVHEETLADYHERLRNEQKETDEKLKGKVFWASGTYVTPETEPNEAA